MERDVINVQAVLKEWKERMRGIGRVCLASALALASALIVAVVAVAPARAAASAGPFWIGFRHSGKCIDNYNGRNVNQNPIQQWECAPPGASNQPNQTWYFDWTDNGWARIRNSGTGKCLNVTGNSAADAVRIQLYTCGVGYNDQFKGTKLFRENGFDFYQLRARHSGKCIDLQGWSTADGGIVQQYSCLPSQSNQQLTWF